MKWRVEYVKFGKPGATIFNGTIGLLKFLKSLPLKGFQLIRVLPIFGGNGKEP